MGPKSRAGSRLFGDEKTGRHEGANVVEQRARIDVEFGGEFLVGARLVQAESQDAHPERRCERSCPALLLRLIGVFPRGHNDSIG
jgi:hypothetical protein